jgi:serine/threonine-protein kinase
MPTVVSTGPLAFASTAHPLPVGAALSPHMTVERVLGTGATSVVYAVRHSYFSELVAVKVVRLKGNSREEARHWLRREAHVYASISDPRIPRAYYVDLLPDGNPYIVMELITGLTLHGLLRRGQLAPRAACTLVIELLSILEKVHEHGVIHRDIKPANVVLSRREDKLKVYLLDFGIARSETLPADAGAFPDPAVAGTLSYMAPELLTGSTPDTRSDLYAVGVVLYQALTGSLPYKAGSTMDLVNAILYNTPVQVGELVPSAPAALPTLTHRAIAKLPALRFQSAVDMQRALAFALSPS